MLPTIAGEFRVVDDPELRFTPSGAAVASFRIVANSRKQNAEGKWEDDKVVWLRVSCWRKLAENVAESVTKGALVTVKGDLYTNEYEDKEGNKRSSYEVNAREVGVSLAFNAARVLTTERAKSDAPGDDPWAAPKQDEEPPF